MQDMRRNLLPKFIEICMETPCRCPCGWAPAWRPETNRNICHRVLLQKRKFISRGTDKHHNRNICHRVLLQKRKFISRGTHKHHNNIFYQYKNCSDSQIPRNKSLFLTNMTVLWPSCKCCVKQKLRNSSGNY